VREENRSAGKRESAGNRDLNYSGPGKKQSRDNMFSIEDGRKLGKNDRPDRVSNSRRWEENTKADGIKIAVLEANELLPDGKESVRKRGVTSRGLKGRVLSRKRHEGRGFKAKALPKRNHGGGLEEKNEKKRAKWALR